MKLEAGNKSNYTSFRWGTPGPSPSALGWSPSGQPTRAFGPVSHFWVIFPFLT